MKKKFYILLALMFCLILVLSVGVGCKSSGGSSDGTTKDGFVWKELNGNAIITAYTGSAYELSVPKKINGKQVTVIDDYVFSNCQELTKIIIPEGVISIGEHAFYECNNLTDISLPNSLLRIGIDAFLSCNKLETTQLEAGLYLGNDENPYLMLYSIADNVTSFNVNLKTKLIYYGALSGVASLNSVSVPSDIVFFGRNSFSSSENFKFNTYDNAKYIGNALNPYVVLISCTSQDITSCKINDKTRAINGFAFSDCASLTSVDMADSVVFIGEEAFSYCRKLSDFSLPDSLLTIERLALGGTVVETLALSRSVKYVRNAFYGCNGLKQIIVSKSNTEFKSIDGNLYSKNGKALIKYASAKNATTFTIPSGVTHIQPYAIILANNLTKINFPDSLITLEDTAIGSCNNIESIYLPEGLKKICSGNFGGFKKLKDISIPNSITYVGEYCFDYCDELNYNEYDNAIYLGNESNPYVVLVSSNDLNITFCTVNPKTRIINEGAFYSRQSLTEISIPDSVVYIGREAFAACKNLKAVGFGKNIEFIDIGAFVGCSALEKIELGDGVKEIKDSAFSNCASLESVTIPKGVSVLDYAVFRSCLKLKTVKLHSGITQIKAYAFEYCSSLERVEYAGAEKSWNAIGISEIGNKYLFSATKVFNSKF